MGAEMLVKSKIAKGCTDMRPRPIHRIVEKNFEIKYNTCIGNFFRYEVVRFLDMHSRLGEGILPYPGSYVEQPNKIIEIFKIIGEYKSNKMERDNMKLMQQQKRARGRK